MIKPNPKLAIIVPYRDREEHLARFVPHLDKFLTDRDIDFKIYIIQQDNTKPFNRGWLLNVGYQLSSNDGCDYFCFHDIDMLPEDNSCDYSWVDKPTHLSSLLSKFKYQLVYPEYIGGVMLINKEHFKFANGFSNNYWGWGFEDDDLLYRCRESGIPLKSTINDKGNKKSKTINCMEFTGKDYLEIPISKSTKNVLNESFTIESWVKPHQDLELDYTKDYDEFHIFTRPGFHFGLAYTSGLQYKGCIWDNKDTQHMVVSDRKNDEWSHVVFTHDHLIQRLRIYVNGQETNFSPTDYTGTTKINPSQASFFIGCANPHATKEDSGFFKGQISQVSLWNKCLNPDEVRFITNDGLPCNVTKVSNYTGWKMENIKYEGYRHVVGYWNFDDIVQGKVLDKSGNDNHAIKKGGVIHEVELSLGSDVLIPNRRDGRYTCLDHEENGWRNTKFTHKETRQNQLRFINKVRRGLEDYKSDGLSNLKYTINSKEKFLKKHEFISIDE